MFIHSSIGEHLAYFHLLAVVTNAAKNIVVLYLFQSVLSILGDILIYLSVELLAFVFNFEVSHTVLHRDYTIYISTSYAQTFQFSHTFPPTLASFFVSILFPT